MRTIHRIIVSAIIYSKDNMLFLGKKHKDKGGVYVDCWHLPGGGIHSSETRIDALKREVYEETGIDINECSTELIDDKDKGESEKIINGEKFCCKMKFNVYKVLLNQRSDETPISLGDDLAEYMWLKENEIKSYQLTPPLHKLFNKIGII